MALLFSSGLFGPSADLVRLEELSIIINIIGGIVNNSLYNLNLDIFFRLRFELLDLDYDKMQ